jgi:hypothetical protein
MGLLDDAIREHLELKRRNGADPGEVAREQQEALHPVFPGQAAASDGDAGVPVELDPGDAEEIPPAGMAPAAPPAAPPEAGSDDALATSGQPSTGQETVELDMQSVLHADAEAPAETSPAGPTFAGSERDAVAYEPEPDSLEWEMPGEDEPHSPPEDGHDPPRELPGQGRLSFE